MRLFNVSVELRRLSVLWSLVPHMAVLLSCAAHICVACLRSRHLFRTVLTVSPAQV
jgi:hypothetical protein